MILLKVWLGYAICGVSIYAVVFIWAVRNKQFTDLNRQRYIALEAEKPIEGTDAVDYRPGIADRYTWVVLLLLTCAMVAVALLFSLKGR